MHDLEPITALWGTAPQIDSFQGLTVSECPDWAYASLAARRGQEEATASAAAGLIGAELPGISQSVTSGPFTAFWMGLQQWMIEAPHHSHEDLAGQLLAAVGESASVTEQNDSWVRFDLEGARCHDVLERLCNADTRMMEKGHVTRVQLGTLGCFLICRAKDTHFSVIAPRSSAGSLHRTLTDAAKSVI
ncbi:MAG TPA: sarcosine oxidase, gamma subunit [Paracoccaceae bacterium]|nr:sarcosine oxidase, gamma subunit [Paracoccaceae bacterium]